MWGLGQYRSAQQRQAYMHMMYIIQHPHVWSNTCTSTYRRVQQSHAAELLRLLLFDRAAAPRLHWPGGHGRRRETQLQHAEAAVTQRAATPANLGAHGE